MSEKPVLSTMVSTLHTRRNVLIRVEISKVRIICFVDKLQCVPERAPIRVLFLGARSLIQFLQWEEDGGCTPGPRACAWGHVGVNTIWVVSWLRRNMEVCVDRSCLHYSHLQRVRLAFFGERPTRPLQLLARREREDGGRVWRL